MAVGASRSQWIAKAWFARSTSWSVCTLDEMNAAEYVASDPLDLDHLSRGANQ